MKTKTVFEILLSRRDTLAGIAASGAAWLLGLPNDAFASPADAKQKIQELTGSANPQKARVTVELPDITDQGPLTPIRIVVDSPMTATDYVKEIHIVAERNTVPEVASFRLGPHNGRAEVTTRIRIRESQIVDVAAVMSDGGVYLGRARCRVTGGAGGCG